jgi:hypothetical protein
MHTSKNHSARLENTFLIFWKLKPYTQTIRIYPHSINKKKAESQKCEPAKHRQTIFNERIGKGLPDGSQQSRTTDPGRTNSYRFLHLCPDQNTGESNKTDLSKACH